MSVATLIKSDIPCSAFCFKRFEKQIILKNIGVNGQKKILNSKVLIIGLGGLGCPAVDYLCRAGVGQVGLVDFDKVSLSNIHRQGMYNSQDVGKLKVDVIYTKIKKIEIKKADRTSFVGTFLNPIINLLGY